MFAAFVPLATYRIQFHGRFGFSEARSLVPYLHELGIGDVYASPLLKCQHDSDHGYDVSDHTQINPALGSEADLEDLAHELAAHGMGLIVDVVPNHMGILDPENRWWQDVLENGPSSPYAPFFDIDWNPPKEDFVNKVLLPILGDQYGKVLENGEIHLEYEAGAFAVSYYERRFPVAPRTWKAVLEPTLAKLRNVWGAEDRSLLELESIIRALEHLPPRYETDPELVRERQREKDVAKRRLASLVEQSPTLRAALEEEVRLLNGRVGDPRSFDRLDELLAEQAYRLSFWRVAAEEINYRRFFDVNDLAAIRVEEPEVFREVHARILGLVVDGVVTGLRIDHPDGLFDPEQYFLDLQEGCRQALTESLRGRSDAEAGRRFMPTKAGRAGALAPPATARVGIAIAEDAEAGRTARVHLPLENRLDGPRPSLCSEALQAGMNDRFYVVVEKILEPGERLPGTWAVHGTTGYEFLNLLNGIFVDPAGDRPLRNLYSRFAGITSNFADLVYESKKLILDVSMSSELHVLARRLDRISEQHRTWRDFTLWSLQEALAEVIACFPVYRTYVRPGSQEVSDADRRHITWAVRAAKRRNAAINESVFDFIAKVLLLDIPEGLDEAECRDFVMRFQQITAPVMAKGLEDTAFYRSYRLASLNEVGGDPSRWGVGVEQFHHENALRREHWPMSMSATSTHDTKRSEDVRARINVLSEIPDDWSVRVRRWRNLNRRKRREVEGAVVPDANEEYLLYQTLVGTWPLSAEEEPLLAERIAAYLVKAARERKVHTSWISPNQPHEDALVGFAQAVLDRSVPNPFLEDFLPFQQRVAFYGAINSLAQVLLKVASPGVPDFYQGTELWDFSLVDPDNRRPVDFARRERVLRELQERQREDPASLVRELVRSWQDGRIKLLVTQKALRCRREQRELFQLGDYLPLWAAGTRSGQVCAFARRRGDDWAVAVAPRWLTRTGPAEAPEWDPSVWTTTRLLLPPDAPEQWRNVLTGQCVAAGEDQGQAVLSLEDVFGPAPVALLQRWEE